MVGDVIRDFNYAIRSFARRPLFTAVIALTWRSMRVRMTAASRLMSLTSVVTVALFVLLLVVSLGDRAIAQTSTNQITATSTNQDACKDGTVACVISSGLDVVSAWALPLFVALAGIGVLTMALIQAAKDVFPIRRVFHRRALGDWLKGRKPGNQQSTLIVLATGGDATALFDLPTTSLMGQLTTVSRIALLFPKDYELLLLTFAGDDPHVLGDIRRLVDEAGTSPDELERARVRVGHMMERNIDALQISLSSRWERGNKLWAFVVSALVTLITVYVFLNTTELSIDSRLMLTLAMVPVSVLAGFVAPVAKDLVTALESLRKS